MDNYEYVTQYPGIYPEYALDEIREYIAKNEAIKARGPVNTEFIRNKCIPEDYPGYWGCIEMGEDVSKFYAEKLDPYNRLFTDKEYAMSLGFEGLPIHHPVSMAYSIGPFPVTARDQFTPCNISHYNKMYHPIYAHDTLYFFIDENSFQDLTPEEGSEVRTIALTQRCSCYNQDGVLCTRFEYNICELLRVMKDRKAAEEVKKDFHEVWKAPDWWRRERHYYTDKDWEFIKGIWEQEVHRGAEPVYWEDVNIGDRPPRTLEGPIDDTGGWPNPNFGLVLGGDRTLREEIMDPDKFKTMVRNPYDGIYRLTSRNAELPYPPERLVAPYLKEDEPFPPAFENDDPACEPFFRFHFINHLGRDLMFRHFYNYFGDHSLITDWHWAIMSPDCMKQYGFDYVMHPNYEPICDMHPSLKNIHVNSHGLEGDVGITNSYVVDKYIRDGKHFIKLAWWIEEIEGSVWEEGWAEIRLPARNGNL